jgi:membrane dipeptidase
MREFSRRSVIVGTVLAAAARPALARKSTGGSAYRRMIVIDGLGALSDPYAPPEQARLSARAIAEILASGVSAITTTVSAVGNGPKVWEETLETISMIDKAISANADFLMPLRNAADYAKAKAAGKLGIMYGTQDTSLVGSQLNRLSELKAKGLRQIQLTYNLRNLSGDGALEPANAGLSKLGRATIARIEAEKLLLDLSHGGARTIAEAIEAATRPMIISHTGCRDLHDNPRNVFDASLRAVAAKGGVVGIYFMPFLAKSGKPTGADLIRHIEHAAKICGEDHVSLGTDGYIFPQLIDDKAKADQRKFFEERSAAGIAAPGEGPDVFNFVADYNSIDKFERLAADLGKRGWTVSQVEKLLGGNLIRLYRDVWGG